MSPRRDWNPLGRDQLGEDLRNGGCHALDLGQRVTVAAIPELVEGRGRKTNRGRRATIGRYALHAAAAVHEPFRQPIEDVGRQLIRASAPWRFELRVTELGAVTNVIVSIDHGAILLSSACANE